MGLGLFPAMIGGNPPAEIGMLQNGLFKTDFEAHDNFSSFFSKFLQSNFCACPITFITTVISRMGEVDIELDHEGRDESLTNPGEQANEKEPLATSRLVINSF